MISSAASGQEAGFSGKTRSIQAIGRRQYCWIPDSRIKSGTSSVGMTKPSGLDLFFALTG